MSDDSDPAAAVAAAKADVAACQKAADAAKDRCLHAVADGLRARIDEIGKRVAKEQPDVALALGRSGIEDLRADLADVADAMAADLIDARDRITWTDKNGDAVHNSLFPYLNDKRMRPISTALKQRGFDTSNVFLPQSLYGGWKDEELSTALTSLEAAEAMLKHATEAQKKQSVDDLWD